MSVTGINIDPLLHSKIRFLIMTLLMDKPHSAAELSAAIVSEPAQLCLQAKKLFQAGYILTNTEDWEAFSETVFDISEAGIKAYQLYAVYLQRLLVDTISKRNQFQKVIELKVNGKNKVVEIDTIKYLRSMGNYVKIVTEQGTFVSPITTAYAETLLSDKLFLRVHKSFIVNTGKILRLDDNEVELDTIKIKIGKTYKRYIEKFRELTAFSHH